MAVFAETKHQWHLGTDRCEQYQDKNNESEQTIVHTHNITGNTVFVNTINPPEKYVCSQFFSKFFFSLLKIDKSRTSIYNTYMAEKKKKDESKKHHMKNDEFVRSTLSEKETALSFFQNYLPAEIIKHLDFESLKIAKDSFVDKKMSRYFSDLIYEVKLDGAMAFIYLLIEHKSQKAPMVAFQLLKYLVRIWELFLKQHKGAKKLPVILPMLIYHGEMEWDVDTQFISLFEVPDDLMNHVWEYIPNFHYRLYDISQLPDEDIKGEVRLRIALFTLKYVLGPLLLSKLSGILKLFDEFNDKNKEAEYLETLFEYLVSKLPKDKKDEFMVKAANLKDEGGKVMKTIADSWKASGKKEGKKETTWEIIKRSLKEGLPINTIERITGVPVEKINSMREKMAQG